MATSNVAVLSSRNRSEDVVSALVKFQLAPESTSTVPKLVKEPAARPDRAVTGCEFQRVRAGFADHATLEYRARINYHPIVSCAGEPDGTTRAGDCAGIGDGSRPVVDADPHAGTRDSCARGIGDAAADGQLDPDIAARADAAGIAYRAGSAGDEDTERRAGNRGRGMVADAAASLDIRPRRRRLQLR